MGSPMDLAQNLPGSRLGPKNRILGSYFCENGRNPLFSLGVPYGVRTRVTAVKGQGQIGNFRQMGAIMHNFEQHQNGRKQPRATV